MQAEEMKRIRKSLGMERIAFARLIGYTGTDRNSENRISAFENGRTQIPLYIARLVWLIDQIRTKVIHADYDGIEGFDLDQSRAPIFPEWPGYEFSHEPDPQHQKEPVDV